MSSKLKERLKKVNPDIRETIIESDQIAGLIVKRLEELGWNKSMLAQKIGAKSPSVITRYLTGQHNFTINTIKKLERALDCKIMYIGDSKSHGIVLQSVLPADSESYSGEIFTHGVSFKYNSAYADC